MLHLDSQGLIHLADMALALFPRAWLGRSQKDRASSFLEALARQIEFVVEDWPFKPLVQLPHLLNKKGNKRHVQDVQWKDGMLSCAKRAGAGLTATRLVLAQRALAAPAPQLSTPSRAASSSSDSRAVPTPQRVERPLPLPSEALADGIQLCGVALLLAWDGENEIEPPAFQLKLRDQTDYSWPPMASYRDTCEFYLGPRHPGPLHVSFDGVFCDQLGELNQFWDISPARPRAGVPERSCILPIQEFLKVPYAFKALHPHRLRGPV